MIEDTALLAPPLAPNRLAGRLLADFQAATAAVWVRAFGGDLDRSIIFTVVARRSIPLPPAPGHIAAGDRPQAITINALAASLSRPFETIRRHANGLLASGLCERTPRGIIVPADAFARPEIAEMLTLGHDLLVRMIDDMATFGMPLPHPRDGTYQDPNIGIAAALDAVLGGVEFGARQHDCWLEMVILAAVICANARPSAEGYAPSPFAPDRARLLIGGAPTPVTIVAIARALGLPYSTVRRHAEAMLREGVLLRRRNGLVANDAWLTRPALAENASVHAEHIRRILARLATAGFPFDDPTTAYLSGRPPMLEFSPDADPEDTMVAALASRRSQG